MGYGGGMLNDIVKWVFQRTAKPHSCVSYRRFGSYNKCILVGVGLGKETGVLEDLCDLRRYKELKAFKDNSLLPLSDESN